MNLNASGRCWQCGHALSALEYGRELVCPSCSRATHACRNCRFYRPGLHNDCQEPIAEGVLDKERANFCDYFEPHAAAFAGEAGRSDEEIRRSAEDLFKN
jgi:hypothetical protein